ncbi:MAG: rod shape-determining protein MreC, partial [Rhizomicrobium sp.]
FTIYSDNIRLKEENARLMKWHNSAVVLADRVKRYQLLLHAVHDPALSSEVARVIGRSNHPFVQTMILDAGKSAGVKPGQAVVDDRGMVGRIFLTGERTAWVIPLTDLNSRIPVTIVPGNAQAIMAGNNTRMPAIEVLSHGVDITAGAQVISSGDGDILPAGLPVGVIVAYGHDFRVALFADQSTATDVQILDYKQPMEQPHVPTAGDLPVTAAGLPPAPTPPPVSYATPQGMQTGGAAPLPNGQLKPAQSVSAPVGSPANNAVRVPQAAGKPNVVQSMVGAPAGAKPVVSKPAAVKVTPKVPAKTAPNAADAGDTE